jgi:hypothetical protein
MHFVSLPIEILRTRPALIFWLAALTQAAIWVAVPSLFYATPPDDLTGILSISPQWRRLAPLTPPLPYVLAETAFRLGGFFGIYLLAQICVVTTLWAVFALGRAALDPRHAVLGTLLMTGIYFMTVPTPDFSAAILAMPLWALALLHLWRAAIEGDVRFWLALAFDLVLLSATTALAPLMIALLIAFVLLHPLTRQRLLNPYAAAAGVLILAALALSGYWLKASGGYPALAGIPDPRHVDLIEQNLRSLGRWLGRRLFHPAQDTEQDDARTGRHPQARDAGHRHHLHHLFHHRAGFGADHRRGAGRLCRHDAFWPLRGPVRACDRAGGGRGDRIQAPARGYPHLARFPAGAARHRRDDGAHAALDSGRRPARGIAIARYRQLLRRQFRAPHRPEAADRRRRSCARDADLGRRGKPSAGAGQARRDPARARLA